MTEHVIKTTDKRLLFSFIAAVLVFMLLAVMVERNQHDIRRIVHEQGVSNWNQCQRSVTNTTKINATDQAFIDFLRSFVSRSSDPASLRNFIAIYEDAKLDVPVCGPRPK